MAGHSGRARQQGEMEGVAGVGNAPARGPGSGDGFADVDERDAKGKPRALGAKGIRAPALPLPCVRMSMPGRRPSTRLPEIEPSR
jgi:hypothetical protein